MKADVAHILTIHSEPDSLVLDCVRRVRQHFAGPIHVINDGGEHRTRVFVKLLDSFGVTYDHSGNLKRLQHGAAWWARFFQHAITLRREWTVKLDADTRLHFPPDLPPEGLVAGTVMSAGQPNEHLQGGYQCFHAASLGQLLACAQSPEWQNPASWRMGEADYFIHRGFMSTDYVLAAMLRKLGFGWVNMPDLDCRSIYNPAKQGVFREDAAVTHPHKSV